MYLTLLTLADLGLSLSLLSLSFFFFFVSIAFALPGFDRVVFLDGDVVLTRDIESFFRLSSQIQFAGVVDQVRQHMPTSPLSRFPSVHPCLHDILSCNCWACLTYQMTVGRLPPTRCL
jgi:lipopolysaccharide biosynthesis glycosyltransferase